MSIYGVSRDTIRKVLNLLVERGIIQKNKGKGSLVLDIDRISFPVSGVVSFNELKATMDCDVETELIIFVQSEITKDIKKHLNMDSGKIYHVERVRKINGEKIILDIDYLNGKVVKGLEPDHAKVSLYKYIEDVLGLKIGFAKKEITVVKATERERELLDLNEYDVLVCVKSYTYLDDATLFEYTISKHRPDKFRFVDFARRSEF